MIGFLRELLACFGPEPAPQNVELSRRGQILVNTLGALACGLCVAIFIAVLCLIFLGWFGGAS